MGSIHSGISRPYHHPIMRDWLKCFHCPILDDTGEEKDKTFDHVFQIGLEIPFYYCTSALKHDYVDNVMAFANNDVAPNQPKLDMKNGTAELSTLDTILNEQVLERETNKDSSNGTVSDTSIVTIDINDDKTDTTYYHNVSPSKRYMGSHMGMSVDIPKKHVCNCLKEIKTLECGPDETDIDDDDLNHINRKYVNDGIIIDDSSSSIFEYTYNDTGDDYVIEANEEHHNNINYLLSRMMCFSESDDDFSQCNEQSKLFECDNDHLSLIAQNS